LFIEILDYFKLIFESGDPAGFVNYILGIPDNKQPAVLFVGLLLLLEL